jgi:hypothetical protein
MIRFLIRTGIFFLSALIGIIVANLLLDDMHVDTKSYLYVAIIFALIQAVLSPLIFKGVARNATAFTGGIGIISTLVALIITDVVSDGMSISGIGTWILAALIVWLAGALAAFLLPLVLLKKVVNNNRV